MARQYIDFDVNEILGELDLFQRKELPYAASQALKKTAYEIAKTYLPRDMEDLFDRPVAFTVNSVRSDTKGLVATFIVKDDRSKGQSPAEYLYPVSTQDTTVQGKKDAFETRFSRRLKKDGVIPSNYWPVPFPESRGLRIIGSTGNVSPGQYRQVLAGVLGPNHNQGGYRHFSVPDLRGKERLKGNPLKDGIYRVKGNDVQLLFQYARTQPQTKTIFDFVGFTYDHAADILPGHLEKALQRAVGR